MRRRFALLALLAVLVLAAAACGGDPPADPGAAAPATTAAAPEPTSAPPTTRAETAPQAPRGVIPAGEREAAPDIQVTAFDGRTVTLGGFRGQPVVVNFFESW